jgi:Nuclease-related domain
MTATRWTTITPSQYPWERTALDFIRGGLPDPDPYRAWSNFEFQAPDGALYEVDLLVLTPQGFWLVEIKSRPGRVEGDAGTWTWTDNDGRRISMDSPVLGRRDEGQLRLAEDTIRLHLRRCVVDLRRHRP